MNKIKRVALNRTTRLCLLSVNREEGNVSYIYENEYRSFDSVKHSSLKG